MVDEALAATRPALEDGTVTGYLHADYAASLAEFGEPRLLPNSGGWILVRPVPGFAYRDAMGCYPLFACRDWSRLAADFDSIGSELVSLAVVTDPFGIDDPGCLQRCFGDVVIPFKEHLVVDLERPLRSLVSRHHRRGMASALKRVSVEVCHEPITYIDEWMDLYSRLIRRHAIQGIRTFSRSSFLKQLAVPGIVMFRGTSRGATVGMSLWYVHRDVAYGHLAASSHRGYRLEASFALFACVIDYFASKGLKWLDLGAGAGLWSDERDGLARFKRGWATGTRTAYLCGRVFDRARYAEVTETVGTARSGYFPAYRHGEFR